MSITSAYENLILVIPFLIFIIGISCLLLRRLVVWNIVGQIISLKAVVIGGFLTSVKQDIGHADLVFVSLIILSLIPQAALVGMLVIHRCARFNGSLDLAKQGNLKN
jgi:hypothetical protein